MESGIFNKRVEPDMISKIYNVLFGILMYYMDLFDTEYYDMNIYNENTNIIDRLCFIGNLIAGYVVYTLSYWFDMNSSCFDNNGIQRYFFNNMEQQFINNVDKSKLGEMWNNNNMKPFNHDLDGINYYTNKSKPIILEHIVIQPNEYSYDKIKEISKDYSIPVLIKGLSKDTIASKKWSPEYFTKYYSNATTPIISPKSDIIRYASKKPMCAQWDALSRGIESQYIITKYI